MREEEKRRDEKKRREEEKRRGGEAHVVEDVDAEAPDAEVVDELPPGLAELLEAARLVLVAPLAEPALHRALLPAHLLRQRLRGANEVVM